MSKKTSKLPSRESYGTTESTAQSVDQTDYLLSSEANARHLRKSIEQMERGDMIKLSLDQLRCMEE